jgi:hypothetical protein
MAGTFRFKTPAQQIDFEDDPKKQAALVQQWNANLDGFTQQGITGNPWNSTNASGITNYYNPMTTTIPPGTDATSIPWPAFPGRIGFYFPQLSATDQLSLADTGYQSNGQSFPNITKDPCSGKAENLPFGPYGPRGWQDEYCEWCVTRDTHGKIVRVDFTCENPEYWNSLWMIDPDRVCELYQSTLGKPQIQVSDLYLHDASGQVVIDPSTGRPAYNPLNKWNSGPVSTASSGGAMHLTSTPNTLQTEIGLASAATIQRTVGNTDPTKLICCAQFGQPHRNSDPHIGLSVNVVVGGGATVSLTNPPGLYIQTPDFQGNLYKTPDGTDPSTFWTVLRGRQSLKGDDGSALPGNFILHAVYAVPPSKGYTVSDITINGQPIQWGGQIVQTFDMQIVATGLTATAPPSIGCVGNTSPSQTLAQPLQMFHAAVFNAMSAQAVANPVKQPMTLASNSTLIAPLVAQGASGIPMVVTCSTVTMGPSGQTPTVTFDGDGDITATVTGTSTITYAVPGNSYPSQATVMNLSVTVKSGAQTGLRNVFVTNYGQSPGPAMPALLNVVPAGSIGS